MFSSELFGSAYGTPENSYQIVDGRFPNVSSIYDPHGDLIDKWVTPSHNAYGYIGPTCDWTVRAQG